jgi:radical SAM protein with 4Fe4S-binding SPASM domain
MRIRPEPFGAFVFSEDPPMVIAIDRRRARELGVAPEGLWEREPDYHSGAFTAPIEVHVSVTERCPLGCSGCYTDAKAHGHEPAAAAIDRELAALAERGVFRVTFGGGEPSLRADIGELASIARSYGLSPSMTTSGIGVSDESVDRYRGFAQVNVSYDGVGDDYAAARGYDGAEIAERAIETLTRAGIAVGVNTMITRRSFERLPAIAERASELGAIELQLLRYKPAGRGRLDYLARRLDEAQIGAFPARIRALVDRSLLSIRIDCALVPFLASSVDPALLARFGVMGCEAGRALETVDARGKRAPCSFWPKDDDGGLERVAEFARTLPEPCASCEQRAVCRGGCRIVSAQIAGTLYAPDPECPKVRAHARSVHET